MAAQHCPVCGDDLVVVYEDMSDDRFGCPRVVSIYQCCGCGHFSVSPRLGQDEIGNLYEMFYGRSSSTDLVPSKTVSKPWRRWILGQTNLGHFVLDPLTTTTLLDVGSGDCQNLCDAIALGFKAVGYDVDRTSVTIGERNSLEVRAGMSVGAAYPNRKFSAIQLNQVIEHYLDPRAQLHELQDHLDDGGRLFISTPNAGSVFRRMFGRRWINWHVPYHQHHFTKKSLTALLEHEGLEVVSQRTVTPIVWFVLQVRQAASRPVRGQPSTRWGSPETRLGSALLFALTVMMLVPVRLLDAVGLGDSLVVVATRKQ